MSYPVFQVPAGDVLPIFFDSFDGGTGASVTMSGLAITDIEIYKDGSVTQRASDAGYTLLDTDGIDYDGITGIHGFSIDTSDNTDSGFYTVGAWFTVIVSAVTIDTQTVSFIAAQFRLVAAEGVAGKPKVDVDAWLGTAAATPTTAGVPEVDVTHFGGSAGTFASGVPAVNTTQISGDSTAADNCEAYFDGTGYTDVDNLSVIRANTAQAGAAGTITLDASASASNDFYNNTFIQITGGTGAGQARFISDYDGSTKVATVNANWVTNPDNTSVFIIWPFGTLPGASAPSAADIWSHATRTLTAIDEDSTTLDIDAAVRAAVGLAAADLDTQIGTLATQASVDDLPTSAELATALGTADDAVLAAIAALHNFDPTTDQVIVATNNDKTGYALTADIRIKKNTALANFTFLMVDTSDVPAESLTVTAERSLDGGALGSMTNSVVEISNGLYKINLAQADTNADICCYRFTATGAKDRVIMFPTQTE